LERRFFASDFHAGTNESGALWSLTYQARTTVRISHGRL